jgi:hypothetical protein
LAAIECHPTPVTSAPCGCKFMPAFVLLTVASARSLPALMYPIEAGVDSNVTCTCPPIRSVSEGPAPAAVPHSLRDTLLKSYQEIMSNYMERRWEPSELNGGKFCEAVYSIISGAVKGNLPAKASARTTVLPTDNCMRHFRILSSDAKPAEAEPARRVRPPGGFSLVEASALDRGDLSCSPSPRSSAADCVAGHIGLELGNVGFL